MMSDNILIRKNNDYSSHPFSLNYTHVGLYAIDYFSNLTSLFPLSVSYAYHMCLSPRLPLFIFILSMGWPAYIPFYLSPTFITSVVLLVYQYFSIFFIYLLQGYHRLFPYYYLLNLSNICLSSYLLIFNLFHLSWFLPLSVFFPFLSHVFSVSLSDRKKIISIRYPSS